MLCVYRFEVTFGSKLFHLKNYSRNSKLFPKFVIFIEILVFPAASLWLAMQNLLELFGIRKKMLDEAAVTGNVKI